MLVGPPPKSRSFFSFLTKELRQKVEDNFDDDPEWYRSSGLRGCFWSLRFYQHRTDGFSADFLKSKITWAAEQSINTLRAMIFLTAHGLFEHQLTATRLVLILFDFDTILISLNNSVFTFQNHPPCQCITVPILRLEEYVFWSVGNSISNRYNYCNLILSKNFLWHKLLKVIKKLQNIYFAI